MPQIARIIGGAGTGKTTRLLELMDKALSAGGYDPFDVGFVSFTRAARQEAAERAGDKFSVRADDLQQFGWFRTLHSACHRLLEVRGDSLIADTAADRRWIAEQIDDEVSGTDDGEGDPFAGKTTADKALAMWSTARNRMCPYEEVHRVAKHCEPKTPPLSYCRNVVERYEQAKRLDGRSDFVDLLARYAGVRCGFDGVHDARPEGYVPSVPVWFLDEQQDNSALIDRVCRRITSEARWVYVGLDPFQAIYGWAGASYRHAMSWDVQRQDILRQSYRCPKKISDLGEQCLRRCSDYWDREIQPAEHDGSVDRIEYETAWTDLVKPGESWLLLGRTNYIAQRLSKRMDAKGIPWTTTSRYGSRWTATRRTAAIRACIALQDGAPIDVDEWRAVLKEISGKGLFARGTKKRFTDGDVDESALADLSTLPEWGATEEFCRRIKGGEWHGLINHSREYVAAWNRWGYEACANPGVRVGTIHSAKGMEADNVVLFRTTSQQVARGKDYRDVADEEHRLAYVAVTRARKRLLIVRERSAAYEMEV